MTADTVAITVREYADLVLMRDHYREQLKVTHAALQKAEALNCWWAAKCGELAAANEKAGG